MSAQAGTGFGNSNGFWHELESVLGADLEIAGVRVSKAQEGRKSPTEASARSPGRQGYLLNCLPVPQYTHCLLSANHFMGTPAACCA